MMVSMPMRRRFFRVGVSALVAGSAASGALGMPRRASTPADDIARLAFVNTHTGEKLDVVYREGAQYLSDAIAEIDRVLRDHRSGTIEVIPVISPDESGYAGHGGGDFGLIDALDGLFQGPQRLAPGLDGLAGHRLAFLAEESRLRGGVAVHPPR